MYSFTRRLAREPSTSDAAARSCNYLYSFLSSSPSPSSSYVHHFVVLSTHIIFSISRCELHFSMLRDSRDSHNFSVALYVEVLFLDGISQSLRILHLSSNHTSRRRQQLRAIVALFLRNYFEKWKRWKHGSTTSNCLCVFSFVSAAQARFSDVSSWRCCHVACVLYGFFLSFYDEEKGEQEGRKFFLLNQLEREHFCQHQVDAVRGISRVFPFIQSRKCARQGARSRRIAYMRENSKLSDSFTFFIVARELSRERVFVCVSRTIYADNCTGMS